jgi:hypothetical protein
MMLLSSAETADAGSRDVEPSRGDPEGALNMIARMIYLMIPLAKRQHESPRDPVGGISPRTPRAITG